MDETVKNKGANVTSFALQIRQQLRVKSRTRRVVLNDANEAQFLSSPLNQRLEEWGDV